jgi:hypothetical protein
MHVEALHSFKSLAACMLDDGGDLYNRNIYFYSFNKYFEIIIFLNFLIVRV